jgi:hypothetical protein
VLGKTPKNRNTSISAFGAEAGRFLWLDSFQVKKMGSTMKTTEMKSVLEVRL